MFLRSIPFRMRLPPWKLHWQRGVSGRIECMKTVAIIQARMASTRLPGKVLADIEGRPLLQEVIERVARAKTLDLVAIATSDTQPDDRIVEFCKDNRTAYFRGSLDDVLDRFKMAAAYFGADVIVRLTADCPLLDPEVIDKVVKVFQEEDCDYAANVIECTYPDGLDTEVFGYQALRRAWQEAQLKSEREHVTPYIRNHPEVFRLKNVKHPEDLSSL